MGKQGIGALVALAMIVAAPAADAASTVKIRNQSDWAIEQMYLSSSDESEWGPDQLGEHVIATGETFTLNGIPCDVYDVQLVDEDGDQCVVGEVKLCSDDVWTIDSDTLLSCQALTEE